MPREPIYEGSTDNEAGPAKSHGKTLIIGAVVLVLLWRGLR